MSDLDTKTNELRAAIAALEAQRSTLGDGVVSPALAALRKQLEQLTAPSTLPSEERKIVTILFVDVSGFTALAEKLDAEEVRSVINACFDALVPVVQKYGGTIDKFIGDEIMALFGAPIAHENDPERALRAALEMMDRISAFNEQQQTTLTLHIGVNTGPVVAGAIGSKGRKDYSVMGDAVNLAARLEDASPDGQIFVGPATHRLTSALFDFENLGSIELKGKSEPVVVYRLIGIKEQPQPIRGIEGLRSELIGRDGEINRVRNIVRALQAGSGGIVAIVGEAGVGKSRLTSDSLGLFAPDIVRAEGRALSHTSGMSYWMARDVLRRLLQSSESASADQLDRALRRGLEDLDSLDFDQVYPYLATLLQLPLMEATQERVRFLSTEALHGRILRAFHDYVSACAARQPLVIVWEDLQWCDPSSMLVLENLFPLVSEFPLLILLAYRPEEETRKLEQTAAVSGGQRFHLIGLSPLGREQSASLVEKLLQVTELPARIRDVILDRAEGNPFFIEELLRSFLDAGALAVDNGRLVVRKEVLDTPIPETVQGVIAARLDRLPANDKETLQTAAVIGREFSRNVLESVVSSVSQRSVDDCLSDLCRLEFICRQPDALSAHRFMFKHAITQDVAYGALLRARRKEIHQRVGETLENVSEIRVPELAPTLGYHFERADLPDKAFRYLKLAGEHAQAVFANAEAVAYYRSAAKQAESLLSDHQDADVIRSAAEVAEALGDVLLLQGKNDEARESYKRSLYLSPNDNRVKRSGIQRKIGSAYTVDRRYESMAAAFDAADGELGEQPLEPLSEWWNEKMQILIERMHLFYWQGMPDEMLQLAERYRKDMEKSGTPIQRGKFFQMLGLSELTRARYVASEKAVQLSELAVSTSKDWPNATDTAHIRFTAGLSHLFRGNLPPAIEHIEAALSLAERAGDLIMQTRSLAYLTVAFRRSGDEERTNTFGERTIGLATQLGMVEYTAMAKASLAWLAWSQRRHTDTRSLGDEALNLWHGMSDPYGVDWQAILPLIAVAVSENRLDDAIQYARGLFGENQHPIPAPLADAARNAINCSSIRGERKASLQALIKTATDIGYL